jgi:hypothetical protein
MAPEFCFGTANYSLRTCLRKFRMVIALPPLLMFGLYRPGSVIQVTTSYLVKNCCLLSNVVGSKAI